MRLIFLLRLASICVITIAGSQAFACSCGSSDFGKNNWEIAKLRAKSSFAIFEGTLGHIELKWGLLDAKEGELVPADTSAEAGNNRPRMVATFQVRRAYKGDLGPKIEIVTGLGGGDCGAQFATGLTYLVYAYGPSLNHLHVSMCSPGGWIESSGLATDLRYLRKEHPVSNDFALPPRWALKESAAQKEKRERNSVELKKHYESLTGKICGTVIRESTKDAYAGTVSFLSTAGYSPAEHPMAEVKQDGSFCSEQLGTGKYYLYYTRVSDEGLASAIYYPGAIERAKAMPIEVFAGQTHSNVIFKTPLQKTYSVRGLIYIADKSELDTNNVSIRLFRKDGDPRQAWYSETVAVESFFPLPQFEYFNFRNVLPGRYVVFLTVLGQGWFTKKVEVNVSTHMKLIPLELTHAKK
jgi:hypothetical protein